MKTHTVYLLCFAPGIHRDARANARHYLGSTSLTPEMRMKQHLRGEGSPLVRAAHERGLEVTLVRTWTGTKQTERAMKRARNLPRLCPRCNPQLWGKENNANDCVAA